MACGLAIAGDFAVCGKESKVGEMNAKRQAELENQMEKSGNDERSMEIHYGWRGRRKMFVENNQGSRSLNGPMAKIV